MGKVTWQPMENAPKKGEVEVKLESGEVVIAHFAQDLSGGEQPPFSGWFTGEGGFYAGVNPLAWRPKEVENV
jgi:hypothetical protein